jgi:four helix bundle protein
MKNQLRFQTLDCYQVAKELAKLVHLAKIRDSELRDQATRASKSCFLQLCEGLPNESVAMRRKYFVCAHARLHETAGAVDLAVTLGMMSDDDAQVSVVRAWEFPDPDPLRGRVLLSGTAEALTPEAQKA